MCIRLKILCLSYRKITFIHRRLYFKLNNKIIQLSLDCTFWLFLPTGSELKLQLVSQSSTRVPEKLCQWEYINATSRCNLTTQIAPVQDKWTIYVHCWKIWNSFLQALETGRKASFWWTFINALFRSAESKWIIYFPTMYVDCVYSAMPKKKPERTAKLSEKNRNNRRFHRFWLCPLWSPRLYCYRFLS